MRRSAPLPLRLVLLLFVCLTTDHLRAEPATVAALAEAADRRDPAAAVWAEALAQDDVAVLVAAARGLGRIGGDERLPLLLPLLGHEAASVRDEAAFAIGILNVQQPTLQAEQERVLKLRLVLEPDLAVRQTLLRALGNCGGAASQTLLRDYPLDRIGADERAAWAQAVGLLWSYRRDALPVIDAQLVTQLLALTTGNEPAAEMAAFALARGRKEPEVQAQSAAMLKAFVASGSDGARIFLLRALSTSINADNQRAWLKRMQTKTIGSRSLTAAERVELVTVLAGRATPAVLREVLSLALRSPHPAERIAALQMLQTRPVESAALKDLLQAHQQLQPADAELTASLLAPPTAEPVSEEGNEPLAATPSYAEASKAVGRRFRLVTLRGVIDIELLPDAVYTAANFAKLADSGFYNDTRFHRVIGNFVAQGGDPTGTGEGGPGWRIREELSRQPHALGNIGMATAGKDTAGSQFFVNTGRNPHLDWHYTVFARVTAGLPVALQLNQGDSLIRIVPLP